ncbi:hypothetical protein DFP72DRAFT_505144 [Ephemerocybe angulata]|uniref:Uncharacterized protein n=1 Tax=Ephemerocybe angulata TaxID=980116 RepID=A0A8H6M2H0_9AGAR|nr:hypothetical protein DFP72DRAFT_505144 [Tulosesus angulatus]
MSASLNVSLFLLCQTRDVWKLLPSIVLHDDNDDEEVVGGGRGCRGGGRQDPRRLPSSAQASLPSDTSDCSGSRRSDDVRRRAQHGRAYSWTVPFSDACSSRFLQRALWTVEVMVDVVGEARWTWTWWRVPRNVVGHKGDVPAQTAVIEAAAHSALLSATRNR